MRNARIAVAALLGALALTALAMPTTSAKSLDPPVYIEGGQYTARLDQASRTWRLMPLDGQDLVISNPDIYCRADAPAPVGIWLVAHNEDGAMELRAPSDTALPAGHPGSIAVKACGEPALAGTQVLHAPRGLIDWLGAHSGAVYIGD
jgi:hypothetical protein